MEYRNPKNKLFEKHFFALFIVIAFGLNGCGGGSSDNEPLTPQTPVVITPNLIPITMSGIAIDQGIFDPAPTVDENGDIWMSYSNVSLGVSNIIKVETRLGTSSDGGLNWQDAGTTVNTAITLPLPVPNDINTLTHEVSRLIYNPFAVAAGADPWIILWHRYLSVLQNNDTVRLFAHGWIGMKSGATAQTLSNERKLFTGFLYDPINNSDAFGAPEYPLDTLFSSQLSDCAALTEPGVLAKSNGLYISLLCAKATIPNKIILLRCDHNMNNCTYLGDLLDGSEANSIKSTYDGFSAPELVAMDNQNYLIVSPTISTGDLYRGCVAYKITDLDNAIVERLSGSPVASLIIEENGDFNGACGYIKELTGSGIMMGEAFFGGQPIFKLFTTGAEL